MAAISSTNQTYYFDPAKHEIHDTPADDRARIEFSSQEIMEPADQAKIIQLTGYIAQAYGVRKKLNPHPHPLVDQKDLEIIEACNKIHLFCGRILSKIEQKYIKYEIFSRDFEIPNKQSCYALFEKIQTNLTQYFAYQS